MMKPELLAPAGDEDCLKAALAAGADAVYFGLSEGLNARARAVNFSLERLPDIVERIHDRGARAYLALNTLVFDPELEEVERILRRAAAGGVDAILVQDPAVALLAREVAPDVERHASTQMTLSSPAALRVARDLGLSRVILPRELSIGEIEMLRQGTDLELEVFVHGALCISWSGQCLTSEAWGGRSANRGQCAQACRLPYELIVDGRPRDPGDAPFLLSPRDLAAWALLPRLLKAGVAAFKIEGRQKGAAYVATAVRAYREALDRAMERLAAEPGGAGAPVPAEAPAPEPLLDPARVAAMGVSFSRGFGNGFLEGADHQALVEGRFPGHRGLLVGRVERVAGPAVTVCRGPDEVAVRRGDGLVFEDGAPGSEEGGAVFDALPAGDGRLLLRFGRPGPDLERVRPGMRAWKTSDPAVLRDVRRLIAARAPARRLPVHLEVSGGAGAPLVVAARCGARRVEVRSPSALEPARGGGLDETLLGEKLGRLGDTRFHLESLERAGLPPGLHLPVSELNGLRREYVAALERKPVGGAPRAIGPAGALDRLLGSPGAAGPAPKDSPAAGTAQLIPLCRTDEQLDAVLELGCRTVELDWMELGGLERAVARARERGAEVVVATLRVQKPGEESFDLRIAGLRPDGVLVRHWGALEFFRSLPAAGRPRVHGDFSLNAANRVTAQFLLDRGLDSLTPAHDLDPAGVAALVAGLDPARVTVALRHHLPTFHTEHCVIARLLSGGRDHRSCGRPCETHRVDLRDRTGAAHPVLVDAGCRNTVFDARARTASGAVPRLLGLGVRRFRVEFVRENAGEVRAALEACRALLAGPPRAGGNPRGAVSR